MHAEPRTVGYQFATAKVLAGATDEFRKEELRSLTDPEIREVLESEFSSLPPRLRRMILFDLTFLCPQASRWSLPTRGARRAVRWVLDFESKHFQAGDFNFFKSQLFQTGDPRLMEDMCHRNLKKGHIGQLKQRFSKAQVDLNAMSDQLKHLMITTHRPGLQSQWVLWAS